MSFMNVFMKVDNTECIGNKENWNSSGKEMIALGQHVMGYDDIVLKIKQERGITREGPNMIQSEVLLYTRDE